MFHMKYMLVGSRSRNSNGSRNWDEPLLGFGDTKRIKSPTRFG